MSDPKKPIYYPSLDAEIIPYYDNVVKKLIGLAYKYGTPTTLLNTLTDYNAKLQKYGANQNATNSDIRASIFEAAHAELIREIRRITNLEYFEEADAIPMGIRPQGSTEIHTNPRSSETTPYE